MTCQKILQWRKTLHIPDEVNLSPEAKDVLKRFMCDADDRLGAKGVDEIKAHPFFRGVDWANLRTGGPSKYANMSLRDDDTSRFDKFDEEDPFYPPEDGGLGRRHKKQRKDINFVGYTYKADVEEQKTKLVQALQETLNTDFPNANPAPA